MTKILSNIISKELKIFYFKYFRRRSKSLETLDLIKECYKDQINLFNDHINDLLMSSKKNESKSFVLQSLKKIKNFEGCNKKIMKFLVAELKKSDDSIDFEPEEIQFLFEFED